MNSLGLAYLAQYEHRDRMVEAARKNSVARATRAAAAVRTVVKVR